MGWWSNPQGIPHHNWEETECKSLRIGSDCTVTLKKAVCPAEQPQCPTPYVDRMRERGVVVACKGHGGGGGGGGDEGGGTDPRRCGEHDVPYVHLVLYRPDSIFEQAAHTQASWIRNSTGFDLGVDIVRTLLIEGVPHLRELLASTKCILSISFFGHGGPGWIRLAQSDPGGESHDSGKLFAKDVPSLPTDNVQKCSRCMNPAQAMLYSCRGALGPGYEPKEGDLADPDAPHSIAAAFARRFAVSAYGDTGMTSYDAGSPIGGGGAWPWVTINPWKHPNWWDGGRWTIISPSGAGWAEQPNRAAAAGEVVGRP
jgi:hypothetical protein